MSPDEELRAVAARRGRLALGLTGAVIATYFGFVLLVAFAKEWLGGLVTTGLSRGIALGAAVIVISWLLTLAYVRWTNRHYDAALGRLRR